MLLQEKQLPPAARNIIPVIQLYGNDKEYDIHPFLAKELRKNKWRKVSRGYRPFFVSSCGKYILKQSFLSEERRIPDCSIPTYKISEGQYPWMIQAKANRSPKARNQAWRSFNRKINSKKNCYDDLSNCDIHEGNVGVYKGKSVLIDW